MAKKILLVEDLEFDVLFTKQALQECGVDHEITVARDGASALALLHESRFDLVILDLKMPRVDGFQALRYLRVSPLIEPVLVMIHTASDLEQDRLRAASLGAAEYIYKSMDFSQYQHDLRQALERHGYC